MAEGDAHAIGRPPRVYPNRPLTNLWSAGWSTFRHPAPGSVTIRPRGVPVIACQTITPGRAQRVPRRREDRARHRPRLGIDPYGGAGAGVAAYMAPQTFAAKWVRIGGGLQELAQASLEGVGATPLAFIL
jgi:hypothetical protein